MSELGSFTKDFEKWVRGFLEVERLFVSFL
jgi:hypothetical protein